MIGYFSPMNFADKIIKFISSLHMPVELPEGVVAMNPFLLHETLAICKQFYNKFYSDDLNRWMIIGINPGRFGGGVTGIPFTDPIRLENELGIPSSWPKKQELSSLFIYDMINAYGGAARFYETFYFTSISPLGFTRNNKNLNYYDDKLLQQSIKNFAVECMNRQLKFGFHRNAAFVLGEGKNFDYMQKLNDEFHFFEKIVPLSHPRFIMQYRLKRKDEFIDRYLQQFQVFC